MVIPTCHPDRKHEGRGLCKSCYNRHHKQDTLPPLLTRPDRLATRCKHLDKPYFCKGMCKTCYKEDQKRRRRATDEEYRKRESRRRFLRKEYGLSLNEYSQLLLQHNNVCAICKGYQYKTMSNLAVDHNHKTGEIRGLLCNRCNSGLGFFNDNKHLLINAIKYLENYE